jgi:hypothetical protein
VRSKVLTAVTMKIFIFRDVTPFSLVDHNRVYPVDGGSTVLQNVRHNLEDHMISHPKPLKLNAKHYLGVSYGNLFLNHHILWLSSQTCYFIP